ncbi:hypothetical protein AB0323_07630 [Arthrobacter sp. NPDC080031]|uniref:hypothetical protein n=1 Tax=Arthrobacter sp. NPDC080031 TaxID=3155918 RepID=UPI00344E947F
MREPAGGGQAPEKEPVLPGARLSSFGLIGVGTWPETGDPTSHGNSTGMFLILGVISLFFIACRWLKDQTISAIWIFVFTACAIWGGITMLAVKRDNPDPAVLLGTWERMIVYGLIAGMFVIGYTLSIGRRPEARHQACPAQR